MEREYDLKFDTIYGQYPNELDENIKLRLLNKINENSRCCTNIHHCLFFYFCFCFFSDE